METKTYNRSKRRELLNTLLRRKRILLNSKLLKESKYNSASQDEIAELIEGKCPDKDKQKDFNKSRNIMFELFNIDNEINAIKIDLETKNKKK